MCSHSENTLCHAIDIPILVHNLSAIHPKLSLSPSPLNLFRAPLAVTWSPRLDGFGRLHYRWWRFQFASTKQKQSNTYMYIQKHEQPSWIRIVIDPKRGVSVVSPLILYRPPYNENSTRCSPNEGHRVHRVVPQPHIHPTNQTTHSAYIWRRCAEPIPESVRFSPSDSASRKHKILLDLKGAHLFSCNVQLKNLITRDTVAREWYINLIIQFFFFACINSTLAGFPILYDQL